VLFADAFTDVVMFIILSFSGSGGMGYFLGKDPPGKNDLIVHEYFALVHGNYTSDESGEVQYDYDHDLAASWKQITTEFAESTEQRSTQNLKKVQEQAKIDEVVTKGVLSRNQVVTRTMNRPPGALPKRQKLNRVNLSSCLQTEDQLRKDDAEKWLLVRVVSFNTHFLIVN
jgi:hypothetical protein